MKAFLCSLGGQISLVLVGMLIGYIVLLHLNLAAEKRSAAKWQQQAIGWKMALDTTEANVRAEAARLKAEDLANKARAEAEYARIETEKTNVQKELAATRARLSSLLRARETGTAPGRASGADMPGASQPASGSDTAGAVSVMDEADKLICEVNTLTSEAWREWWERVRAVER